MEPMISTFTKKDKFKRKHNIMKPKNVTTTLYLLIEVPSKQIAMFLSKLQLVNKKTRNNTSN